MTGLRDTESAALPTSGSSLTYEQYRACRDAMTVAEWEAVKAKARWEQMTPWAVLNEWPSLRGSGVTS